jgi:hypothetical protein
MDGPMIEGARSVFTHLVLRADAIDAPALDTSPTEQALPCSLPGSRGPECRPDARLVAAVGSADRC